LVAADLITLTERGLYCESGGFYIDPWRPTPHAVVTHAHSDHASAGSMRYTASGHTCRLIEHRLRLGSDRLDAMEFGEKRRFGDVWVSLHPAGHVLGSAQVRIESAGAGGPVWVITGDYKTDADPTCEAFEAVACDVFLTESTFGLPIYRWPRQESEFAEINRWWRANAERGRTSVILAYSLGKAQRIMAGVDASIGPIGVHGAVDPINAVYRACGVELPDWVHANVETAPLLKGSGLIIAPPSAVGTTWLRKFAGAEGYSTGFASGWMRVRGRRRWQSVDRGFVISDHADWPGLLRTIRETGAARIGVTHGSSEALARYLSEQGTESFVVPTRFEDEEGLGKGERGAGEGLEGAE
jgi:putative mRNA 3-end processing factor